MAKSAVKTVASPIAVARSPESSNEVVKGNFSRELVFGVVGFAGSGTSKISDDLSECLRAESLLGGPFAVTIIKASKLLKSWADIKGIPYNADSLKCIDSVVELQRLGNEIRQQNSDCAAVAILLIEEIRKIRAKAVKIPFPSNNAIIPDSNRRAYILDSIKHPSEVELLRRIYGNSFALVGVVCDEDKKKDRLSKKYTSKSGEDDIDDFMKNDAKSSHNFGQRVEKTFYMADFYIDNSEDKFLPGTLDNLRSNPNWKTADELSRLIKIVTHSEIVRPNLNEMAMYFADCARLSSACLSRQVGASLIDKDGSLVATGANEVPRAGGGVYGESFSPSPEEDYRCAFHPIETRRQCHNNEQQREIIDELSENFLAALPSLCKLLVQEGQEQLPGGQNDQDPSLQDKKDIIRDILKESRISGLLEFSRAIHAEMDALLSAARQGVSPKGTKLFVTTFPCHYCARHIVTAGVDEVQFIEPYPKSKALTLHNDSITVNRSGWKPPSEGGNEKKVLFTPFIGVAPQLYRRAFMKDRDLKNESTGMKNIGEPNWGSAWETTKLSYPDLEVTVTRTLK